MCLKIYKKPLFESQGYIRYLTRVQQNLSYVQQKACELLHKWRDNIARSEDESTEFVLPNSMLFQMVDKMPEDQYGILACCNPIPVIVRKHCDELCSLIKEARQRSSNKAVTHSNPAFSQLKSSNDKIPITHDAVNIRIDVKNTSVDPSSSLCYDCSDEFSSINKSKPFEILIMEAEPTLPIVSDTTRLENSENLYIVEKILSEFRNSLDALPDNSPNCDFKEDINAAASESDSHVNSILDQDIIFIKPNASIIPNTNRLIFSSKDDKMKVNLINEIFNPTEPAELLSDDTNNDNINISTEDTMDEHDVILKQMTQSRLLNKRKNISQNKSKSKRRKNIKSKKMMESDKIGSIETNITISNSTGVNDDSYAIRNSQALSFPYQRNRPIYLTRIKSKSNNQQINWPN